MKKSICALAVAVLAASATLPATAFANDNHDHVAKHAAAAVVHNNAGLHNRGVSEGWYRKGGVVPSEYRGSRNVVSNWGSYHLNRPPAGYHWIRSDNGEFLLVAVTSGIIANIVLGH